MAFGARWETKEGTFWCLVLVQILLKEWLGHNRRSASPYPMASGATWDFQGGLQGVQGGYQMASGARSDPVKEGSAARKAGGKA